MTHRVKNTNSGSGNSHQDQVVDFSEVREKRLEEKKRKTERIFFKNLLSVYTVLQNSKIFPIDLIDVSEEGCSFQIPHDSSPAGQTPWPNQSENIPIRLYFSADTYLEVHVQIQNSRSSIENGQRFTRYGCKLDQGLQSYAAYRLFVQFLKLYSEHAHKDKGDVSQFYL